MSEYERKRFDWLVFKVDTEGEESLTGMEQSEYYFYMDMIAEESKDAIAMEINGEMYFI
jgi:hypothetical protein